MPGAVLNSDQSIYQQGSVSSFGVIWEIEIE